MDHCCSYVVKVTSIKSERYHGAIWDGMTAPIFSVINLCLSYTSRILYAMA